MPDTFDLARFVDAQAAHYSTALGELKAGAKVSHWMWFIFPQLAGLGRSTISQHFAIGSRAEAVAYLAHPVLGPRLRECAQALLAHRTRSAQDILGQPDDAKLRSSATLFAAVDGPGVFTALLDRYFGGVADEASVALLRGGGSA